MTDEPLPRRIFVLVFVGVVATMIAFVLNEGYVRPFLKSHESSKDAQSQTGMASAQHPSDGDTNSISESMGSKDSGHQQTSNPAKAPSEIGVVATCADVRGWKDYTAQDQYHPGDDVCVYAEALNVNQGEHVDVSFVFRINGMDGYEIAHKDGRYSAETSSSHIYYWDKVLLPLFASPGTYIAAVNMHNNLTGQAADDSTNFRVIPSEPSSSGGPLADSVTRIHPRANQTITIAGSGFGYQASFDGNSPFILISDLTAYWNGGNPGDDVTLRVAEWTDTKIVIQGFTGLYGNDGLRLSPGDHVRIQVWNPQTRVGPATIQTVTSD